MAAPLVEATRRDFNQRLDCVKAEMAERESAVRIREEQLVKAREAINSQVEDKLKCARAQIEADAAARAKRALAGDIEQKAKQIAELEDVLKQREGKLGRGAEGAGRADWQAARAGRCPTRIRAGRRDARTARAGNHARAGAQGRRGKTQSQGCGERSKPSPRCRGTSRNSSAGPSKDHSSFRARCELELEGLLKAKFPGDIIQPVPKGEHGGDVVQQVLGPMGQACGTILWESKRTRNWSDGWLAKLRADQRTAKAEFSVLVSQVIPKGIDTFDFVDGVRVTHPRTVLPVAIALRHSLVEVAAARQAKQGQQGKMEMVYHYLTGSAFRQRVQAIVEAFSSMQEDLDRERKVHLASSGPNASSKSSRSCTPRWGCLAICKASQENPARRLKGLR